jgi:uncharacterized protein YbaP (TraB family)
MGESTRRAKKRWGLASAVLGAAIAALAVAATAQTPQDGLPKLQYAAYPTDERLTAAGSLVRPEIEALREKMVEREIARISASQKYLPAPAIWKIADSDTTIFMFGTIHSLPPGFRWRNPGLEAVIVRADTLLLESVEDPDDGVTFLEGVSDQGLAALPPLRDRVSPIFHPRLDAVQKMLPPETIKMMDSMPTWIAAMGIGFVRDLAAGDIPSQGADDWLEQHFRAVGKPVEAIEDSKQVIGNINAIPEHAQRLMLEAALAAPPRSRMTLDTPAHAWAQGQVDDDSPLRIRPEDLDPSAALADPLLDRRNVAWVTDLLQRMKKPGTTLFAAGAGHFVGPGSVIDLLQQRGIRVERVQ